MTYALKKIYGYDKLVIESFIKDYYDIQNSGHGKIKLKELKYDRMV